jgi:hypothetical protein
MAAINAASLEPPSGYRKTKAVRNGREGALRRPRRRAQRQATETNDQEAHLAVPPLPFAPLAENAFSHYIAGVNHLTKQEIFVICIVSGLLVTGWCVKVYRNAHPVATPVQNARP